VYPAGALNDTLPPWQKVSGPEAETVLGGSGLTVTAWAAEVLLHPLALTVTVYDPAAKAVMLWVVAPLLHK
jgi:hypothetical protein